MTKAKITINQIIQLKQKGITQKEMAGIFQVTQQTIVRWKKPKPIPQKRGCKPKTDEKASQLLNSYISKDNTVTQQEMANYLAKEMGQSISQQTISRILRKHNLTYKKLTYHYAEQDELKVKGFIEKTKPLLKTYPFLALDECGFHLREDPRRGYSLVGSRAVSKKPSNKGEHYTLLLCIKNIKKDGVVYHQLIKGGANWKVFYEFLESINLTSDQKHFLLLDNARIHFAPQKRKEENLPTIKEQLAKKNIEPLYLVSYSPQLNPTELCFNFLRHNIEKNRPRNLKELKNYIDKALKNLSQKDLTKYFKHCFKKKIIDNGKTKHKRKPNGLLPKKGGNIK